MGKVCAVEKCCSGSSEDKRYRNRKKLRQASLFKAPKCPDKRKQWSEILGCGLTISQCVCEQHFSNKDIHKADVIVLNNGVIETIPCIRWSLKPHAMPTNMKVNNEAPMATCEKPLLIDEQKEILVQTVEENEEPPMATCEKPLLIDEQREILVETVEDNEEPPMATCEKPLLIDEQRESLVQTVEDNEEPPMEDCEEQEEILQPSSKDDDQQVENHQGHSSIEEQSEIPFINEDIDPGTSSDDETQGERNDGPTERSQSPESSMLTMDSLKASLKEAFLREGWSWMQKAKNVIFTFHHRGTFEARIHMEMAEDLLATIVTISGRRIPLGQITNMADIRAFSQAVENLQVCSGTGMEAERRASHCFGVLDDREEYKHRRPTERCLACRVLRHKLKRRVSYTNLIPKDRKVRSRLKLVLAKKKCVRL